MAGLFGFDDAPQVSNAGVEYATPAQLASNPLAFNNPVITMDSEQYYKTKQDAVPSVPNQKQQGLSWKQIAEIIAQLSGDSKVYNTPQGSVLQPTPNAAIPFYPLPIAPVPQSKEEGSSTGQDMAIIDALGGMFGSSSGVKATPTASSAPVSYGY